MEHNSYIAEPLKRVSLSYTAGTTPELKDLLDAPENLEFIFGIGTDGLTQFECLLDGKKAGDQGFIEVDKKHFADIFGHIIPCTQPFPVNVNHFFLHYNITNISDPSPREIVRSMAAGGGGCGDGCDCGCGGVH
jgi:hypothetical protein